MSLRSNESHHERLRLIIGLPTIAALSMAALTGCAVANAEPSPTHSETAKALTLEQYVDKFTEFKDPAKLQLPADATPDQFGQWATTLNQEWTMASCKSAPDILDATVALNMVNNSSDFYTDIAQSNADTLSVAMFGSNWSANGAAKDWRDVSVKSNAIAIAHCVQNKAGDIEKEDYVSTAKDGSTFKVTVDVKPGDSGDQAGPRVYTYDTSVENGHIIVDGIK